MTQNDSIFPSLVLGGGMIYGIVFGIVLGLILFTTDEKDYHLEIWYSISLGLVITGLFILGICSYIIAVILRKGFFEFRCSKNNELGDDN